MEKTFAPGDPCPQCGQKMFYDKGEEMTHDHPGDEPCVFCADCGDALPVDWVRMTALED